MAGQGFRRSFKTPEGYNNTPGGRVGTFNQVYLGYVKDNRDAFKMGRLKVWIPEFSTSATDEKQWFTVQYCSPMAGATPVKNNTKEGRDMASTQQSYGWWSVPPDVDNEVVVMFLNGDPNRGIYIGGMYQQFMNHMVPGIPTAPSYSEGQEGIEPPVAEYNRWDPAITNADNHTRARFEPLHESLVNQGLYTDQQRGPSTSGARRDEVSQVYGLKTPSGNHMVFDDSPEDSFIRFRTASGAQILINDTAGYVYIISANGNSWFEISDEGIDAYSAQSISMRSQGDINFHADGSMNLHAKAGMNMFGGAATMNFGSLNLNSRGALKMTSKASMDLKSQGDLSMMAKGSLGLKSKTMALDSSGGLGVSATGAIFLQAPTINQNFGTGPKAKDAQDSSVLSAGDLEDRDLNRATSYAEITTQSIVSRLPTHEPWSGHPLSPTGPRHRALDTSVSTRTVYDGENPSDPGYVDDGDQSNLQVATDKTEFVSPITGPITSVWGPRNVKGGSRFHRGIDVGVPIGTPIVAARAGTVQKAGPSSGYGRAVFLVHDNGYTTEYGHISSATVRPGQKVQAGQQIARSGNTGHSTGPHLHFTIRKNGQAIDPAVKLKNVRRGSRLIAGRN
jgi:murein DD-endopeptidase MepM/ murein hydrolase activator NlpD